MAYGRRGWKPCRTKAREYAREMVGLQEFCVENGISYSRAMDSYYFEINGQKYRVSNHAVEASNRGAYAEDCFTGQQVKMRDEYHNGERDDTVYITAGKTRIKEIYTALAAGKKLSRRGYEVSA